MTSYEVPLDYSALKGKTILLTGCATGIGRATAKFAFENGANLALADYNDKDANELVKELNDSSRVLFRKLDVTDWSALRAFFEDAMEKFGTIHTVLSNAGMHNENLLAESFDSAGKLEAPSMRCLDINLTAHFYVTKLALYHFKAGPSSNHQIVYTASAASYIETPPLYQYGAAKSGLLGLMRALRPVTQRWNVTVNIVTPWMTLTPMMPSAIQAIWGDLPTNSGLGIGKTLLLPAIREDLHGKAFWVGGDEITELEDKIRETQPLWMGAELSAGVDEGSRRMLAVTVDQDKYIKPE
ncbi:NAD(P)-binding protein [Corynespora cassiicola Philippines]|uniref:NAD(P)-binding protein n=1 Tax=Corynespora cassiicola Philippines TaxID=1448308 RepID=A0A2T2P6Q1_CORCC|nr:NAD(P)-binding protein [Corynespora cassiicola Philippines]